ncbi:hypothetical protein QYH69_19495 [Paraburkholderia sp. SARCC-3016]|nr:hypothetical protein [Paraburkholderia sp. SARCC-3016]MDQ7979437.1 hypothetical protein [Paraburkholderia sp. SARCC-3016]
MFIVLTAINLHFAVRTGLIGSFARIIARTRGALSASGSESFSMEG